MTSEATIDSSIEQLPGQQLQQLLVVGGGETALAWLRSLQPGSVNSIDIVSTAFHPDLIEWSRNHSTAILHNRNFLASDLPGKQLVVVTTPDAELNTAIGQQAAALGIPTLVAALPGIQSQQRARTLLQLKPFTDDAGDRKWKRIATYLIIAFVLMVTGHLVISALPLPAVQELIQAAKPYFDAQFLFFVFAGFIAQMVDGALSMGYGVTSATCLMSFGISPVSVSAAIHTSEIVTTGISGYSHYRFGNVNKKLFKHLVVTGVLGAIAGALMLVFLGEKAGKWLMPLIALYAMFLGLKILLKAVQVKRVSGKAKRIGWLAGAGGFLDSFGGGGWGPIVTSTLVARGRDPRFTVGTVCLTEFFVTLASAFTFFTLIGVQNWQIIVALVIGGVIAAPIAARLAGRLPRKASFILLGTVVTFWSLRILLKAL